MLSITRHSRLQLALTMANPSRRGHLTNLAFSTAPLMDGSTLETGTLGHTQVCNQKGSIL